VEYNLLRETGILFIGQKSGLNIVQAFQKYQRDRMQCLISHIIQKY